jgi:hypothetical protein
MASSQALLTTRRSPPDPIYTLIDKTSYELEDILTAAVHIQLCPIRKKNSQRAVPPYLASVQHYYRKKIETVGSLIERLLPKTIHAVTAEGFELKVFLFILAFSLNYL